MDKNDTGFHYQNHFNNMPLDVQLKHPLISISYQVINAIQKLAPDIPKKDHATIDLIRKYTHFDKYNVYYFVLPANLALVLKKCLQLLVQLMGFYFICLKTIDDKIQKTAQHYVQENINVNFILPNLRLCSIQDVDTFLQSTVANSYKEIIKSLTMPEMFSPKGGAFIK